MGKHKHISLIISMLCSSAALAQSIEGIVVDANGNTVSGAQVEIVGSKQRVTTDQIGRFTTSDTREGKLELHISAVGFAHFNQHFGVSNTDNPIKITLARTPIEVIDIKATPFHASLMEPASPVSVLSGSALRQQQAATLGDTLEKQAGVHTNFHAGVASTPIIRGLSGPRVLITQNGLDVSDVSRVGPDHSVATEASTAQQIEVLRGPATLFFGSGAIGGVVNVADQRVPTNNQEYGEFIVERNSVNHQSLGAFNLKTGNDSMAFYADGFWRESDDYRIPKAPSGDFSSEESATTVENSAEQSSGFTLGGSYLLDNGFIGLSGGKLNREYGIPGHTHGDDEHDHNDHSDSHAEEAHVFADLEQTRYQLLGEFNFDNGFLSTVNLKSAYTDYQHSEIEAGTVGTTFTNNTKELRADLLHHPISDWRGGLSIHLKDTSFEAVGAEAFTPPSTNKTAALALMEERHFGDILVQLGSRIERVTIKAPEVKLPSIGAHPHDDHHDEEDEGHAPHTEHDESTMETRIFDVEHEFTPITLSAGLVWDFATGYNMGASFTRSERAPSATELLSFGPHIGTRTYEVGALFALDNSDSAANIGLTAANIDLETALNFDISFRKTQGDLAIIINGFYNQVDNYYYQIATGLFAGDGHDHQGHEHEEGNELPVYLFQTDDVVLHGFEAQVVWQANENIKTTLFSDIVRGRLKDGGNLPRTPPIRFGTTLAYQHQDFNAHIDITRYQTQDKVSALEAPTAGYTLIDAGVNYQLPLADHDISLYAQAKNLTDSYAQVHSSFVKEIAPRQGRSLAVGVRAYF